MEQRRAKMTVIIGANGTGKTPLLRRILTSSRQKALIITPDDTEWDDLPLSELSAPEDFAFSGLKRHIFNPDHRTGTLARLELFKKGIIVFDDCRAYLPASTPPEIRQLLIRRRQREADIFAVGHGFTEIPPVFFTFSTEMILFRTTDNIARRRDCLRDYTAALAAQQAVNRAALRDPHHFQILRWN